MIPRTEYALAEDGVHVAYQVFGDGALDLVFANRMAATIGYMWEIPDFARFLGRLGTMARVMALDPRGVGLSDRRLPPRATLALEQRMMDIRAVMDAARSPRACLVGVEDGASLCALFAATYPERTDRLILYGAFARGLTAPDYPWGWPEEQWDDYLAEAEQNWGRWDWLVGQALTLAPSKRDDEDFIRRLTNLYRLGAGFETVREVWELQRDIDIRAVLPSIQAPTLVLYRADNRIEDPQQGRYLAGSIPDPRFVNLPGADFEACAGDQDALLDEVQEFLTGTRPAPVTDRVLTTVMVTDIVGSTQRAVELGDTRWRDLQRAHHQRVRGCLREYRGREIDTAGDGFLATFHGPARAVRCAAAIMRALADLGISIRAGVHTGEVELASGGISEIAVHAGARIAGAGGAIGDLGVRDREGPGPRIGAAVRRARNTRLEGTPWTIRPLCGRDRPVNAAPRPSSGRPRRRPAASQQPRCPHQDHLRAVGDLAAPNIFRLSRRGDAVLVPGTCKSMRWSAFLYMPGGALLSALCG